MVSLRFPAVAEVESLKLDRSLLALLLFITSTGLGTEDRTLFATHFGYALEDLDKTPHARCSAEGYVPNRSCRTQGNNISEGGRQHCVPDLCGFVHGRDQSHRGRGRQASSVSGEEVKMSALIDPLDDSEVPAAASGQTEEWYRNYKVIKFGHSLPDKEPTGQTN